tara:strand:- start:392 stop:877 length:486 start_codon:yes stop_codon:yes gene_type:complete
MERPAFVVKQHPRKVATLEFVIAIILSIVLYLIFLYVSELAYKKAIITTRLSFALHLMLGILLVFLSLTHGILSHKASKKRTYYFFKNRVEVKSDQPVHHGQKEQVIFYRALKRIIIHENIMDKLFNTGTISFDELHIKHIRNHRKIALFLNDLIPAKVIL